MNVTFTKGKALGRDQGLMKKSNDVVISIARCVNQTCCNVKSKFGFSRRFFALPISGGMNPKEVGGHE
jgi:hypothetical protein